MERKTKFRTGPTGFTQLAGAAGIGFASLIVLGNVFLLPAGLPLAGAPTSEATVFFGSNDGLRALAAGLGPITWTLATVFAAGALGALRRSERDRGEAWSLVGFAGMLLQNCTFTAVIATRLALGKTAGSDSSATTALWALHDGFFALNGTFLALALTGLSIGGLRAGLIERWHGRAGLLAAALQFTSATLGSLVIEKEGPLGLIGLAGWVIWVVWLVWYGVTLLRVQTAGVQPQPQPA
ncbi:hypothetical protein [Flindersiella endophytica]